jgi:hypothetical protein
MREIEKWISQVGKVFEIDTFIVLLLFEEKSLISNFRVDTIIG